SGFTREGFNFEGPAPRPLERLKIYIGNDGLIRVDKSKKYQYELGEWGRPGAYLKT
ncbi:MAG: Rieske (2Fe-2S) protein, partial [Nitrospinaceae bacterium]|nr:Rieske (2Fe-2S) protein [Nitrospinaceae bacterium]NIR54502.1 Rieske (2Fe-2S) protein [Nitrospinaceae bacterium]NIS84921.1 Rieske (2Fe-2S) protein [Nitrospinaceae bacterium]NIT81735.1 Rieske (2Fe-2S) protein [Nitrospinaceae bacterium]NIU44004.1 Rieske (2Fe-2S) protein [Nitrospinaceae bacterium]